MTCLALTPRAAAAQILGVIDSPTINQSVPQPFLISGWAVMTGEATGIDVVHVYGCPVNNCPSPTFWGAATYGIARPDVAAAYGTNNYLYSGFSFLMSGLTPNTAYITKVYAHAWQTNVWYEFTMGFTATATPYHALETPTQNGLATQPFATSGWAIDAAAPTGTGVDAVDVWVYPNLGTGAPPSYVGGATYGTSRPDVAAAYGARFQPSGYTKTLSGQPAGIYWYEVGAHSTATGAWTIRTVAAYVDLPTADLTITRGGTGTGAITATGLSCPGGANTQAVPCSANYPFGTGVTLTAVPDAGSVFTGWTGVCTGTGVCGIGINAPKYVAATFTKIPTSYTVSYYHTDVIGSVRAVTDAAGTAIARHDYKPFGEDTEAPTGDPLRFAGKELDAESSLHYFEARYYRQTWGRFTQVDPVSGWASDPQSFNRYAYARNNPLKYVDPTGLWYSAAVNLVGDPAVNVFGVEDDDWQAWLSANGLFASGSMCSGMLFGSAAEGSYQYYPDGDDVLGCFAVPPPVVPPPGRGGPPDEPPSSPCPSCVETPPVPPGPVVNPPGPAAPPAPHPPPGPLPPGGSTTARKVGCTAVAALKAGVSLIPGVTFTVEMGKLAFALGDLAWEPSLGGAAGAAADVNRLAKQADFDGAGGASALARTQDLASRKGFAGQSAARQAKILRRGAALAALSRAATAATFASYAMTGVNFGFETWGCWH